MKIWWHSVPVATAMYAMNAQTFMMVTAKIALIRQKKSIELAEKDLLPVK